MIEKAGSFTVVGSGIEASVCLKRVVGEGERGLPSFLIDGITDDCIGGVSKAVDIADNRDGFLHVEAELLDDSAKQILMNHDLFDVKVSGTDGPEHPFSSEVVVIFNSPDGVKEDINARALSILRNVVSMADNYLSRKTGSGIKEVTVKPYVPKQVGVCEMEEEDPDVLSRGLALK